MKAGGSFTEPPVFLCFKRDVCRRMSAEREASEADGGLPA